MKRNWVKTNLHYTTISPFLQMYFPLQMASKISQIAMKSIEGHIERLVEAERVADAEKWWNVRVIMHPLIHLKGHSNLKFQSRGKNAEFFSNGPSRVTSNLHRNIELSYESYEHFDRFVFYVYWPNCISNLVFNISFCLDFYARLRIIVSFPRQSTHWRNKWKLI